MMGWYSKPHAGTGSSRRWAIVSHDTIIMGHVRWYGYSEAIELHLAASGWIGRMVRMTRSAREQDQEDLRGQRHEKIL